MTSQDILKKSSNFIIIKSNKNCKTIILQQEKRSDKGKLLLDIHKLYQFLYELDINIVTNRQRHYQQVSRR